MLVFIVFAQIETGTYKVIKRFSEMCAIKVSLLANEKC